ncbi:transposase [Yersinia enterocolitica]|nr:transposase [Yersinia enterocolitica]
MKVSTLGIDLAKNVFQLHGVGESVHNSVSRLKYHYNVITLSRRPSK